MLTYSVQLVLILHDRRAVSGGFDLWESGPETIQAAFYFGAPDQAAPASIEAAMIVQSSAVLSMSKCANAGGACNFDSVFSEVQSFAEVAVSDPCNPNKNCSACIGASSPSPAHCASGSRPFSAVHSFLSWVLCLPFVLHISRQFFVLLCLSLSALESYPSKPCTLGFSFFLIARCRSATVFSSCFTLLSSWELF